MVYQIGGIVLSVFLLIGCGGQSSDTASQPKGQTQGGSDTNVVDSVAAMESGDIYYVDFDDSGNAAIDFAGAAAGSEYMLIVQSTVQTSSSVSVATGDLSTDIASEFDKRLRDLEKETAEKGRLRHLTPSIGKSVQKAVGDSSTFRVLSSIASTTSYTEVTATAKCIKNHIAVYVDNADSSLSTSDIETLCEKFEYAAAIEEDIFGAVSDVNGDGLVVALITPAVNRLGASGGGIITGYFYASDLYARSPSNPTSNEMEIIYVLAPDPSGTHGTAISREFAMSNLLPAVVPHELQHAISYNQHVLVNGGQTEKSWLNEALSHFSEDIVGFGQENPSRVETFLSSPSNTSLAPSSSPNLASRGAEYLFIRYLYEQSENPETFLSSLLNTSNTGRDNIEAAFAGGDAGFDEWEEFMRRWGIATALTNTGISATPQYQFNDRTWNATTSQWGGICLICDADDGRGTILTGPSASELGSGTANISLSGTATAFYTISSPPSAVTLQGNPSAGLQGALIRTE